MINLTKNCPRCKNKYPLTEEHFYTSNSKKSGFRPYCIECAKAMAKTGWGKTSKEAKDRKNYVRKYDISQRANALMSAYRRSDAKKRLEFDLDKVFMVNSLSAECVYCGDNYMPNLGLDRIDNSIGHIKSNVVTCCYECNTARSDLYTFDEMKIIGEAIKKVKSTRDLKVHRIEIPLFPITHEAV